MLRRIEAERTKGRMRCGSGRSREGNQSIPSVVRLGSMGITSLRAEGISSPLSIAAAVSVSPVVSRCNSIPNHP